MTGFVFDHRSGMIFLLIGLGFVVVGRLANNRFSQPLMRGGITMMVIAILNVLLIEYLDFHG